MITTRAGEYAAEWTVESMPPMQRSVHQGDAGVAAPPAAAASGAAAGARQLPRQPRDRRDCGKAPPASTCARRSSARCASRSPQPLCGFYAAAFTRLLALFDIGARAEVVACRGTGGPTCVLTIALLNGARREAAVSSVRRMCAAGASLIVRPSAQSPPRGAGQTPRPARILVMPFENVTRDARIVWLGEASAVLLADDLNALGARAITREERREAFERLQVPPAATLTDATVIRIGQLVGAAEVVVGSLQLDGDTLVVHARSIALEPGRIQADVDRARSAPELFATFERIARQLAPPSARTSADVERTHPPVAAFENYIKGLLAETPATAIGYLNAALKMRCRRSIARGSRCGTSTRSRATTTQALAAVTPVRRDSPWSRGAPAFSRGLSQTQPEAVSTRRSRRSRRWPTSSRRPPCSTTSASSRLRRGAHAADRSQPTYYFNKAAEADPDEPDYFFNLGYAYWIERDTQAAIYWLREAVRRNPSRRRCALRVDSPNDGSPSGGTATGSERSGCRRRRHRRAGEAGRQARPQAVHAGRAVGHPRARAPRGRVFAASDFLEARNYVSTDNAQVDGEKIAVNAPASGTLIDWRANQGAELTEDQVVGRSRSTAGSCSRSRSDPGTCGRHRRGRQRCGGRVRHVRDASSRSPTTSRRSTSRPGWTRPTSTRSTSGSGSTSRSTPFPTTTSTAPSREIQGGAAGVFSLFPQSNSSGTFQKVTQAVRSRSRSTTCRG